MMAALALAWATNVTAAGDTPQNVARAANYRRRLIGAHVNCAPLK